MIGEIDVYGVFVPPLLPIMIAAMVIAAALRAIFSQLGVYRLVWHKPLFDISIYVILTAGVCLMVKALVGR